MKATKQCNVCGKDKPIECFWKHIRHSDGLRSLCKECEKKGRKGKTRTKERKALDRNWETKERQSLTDRIIKQSIYREMKGTIKGSDITKAMIDEMRMRIISHRQKMSDPARVYESSKIYPRQCVICEAWFIGRNVKTTTCRTECEKEKQRRYNFNRNTTEKGLKKYLCNECGESFIAEYGNKRRGFCSDQCGTRHAGRNSKHIRRERFRVAFRERVYKAAIYKRDGFRCQICKRRVNTKAKVPHPLAPTMDHIVALANGGKHEPLNVRLVHFMCNSFKGDRVTSGGDQLLLFG